MINFNYKVGDIMKYFLGYETSDRKIVKIDNNSLINSSTDLFDIVNFTMQFNSLSELRKKLYENRLIPFEYFSVYYCSQKKMGDPTTIKKISNPELKFASDKKYYEPHKIKDRLCEYSSSIEFLEDLTFHYLKKFGVLGLIRSYLEDFFSQENEYAIFDELKSILRNTERKSIVELIMEILDASQKKDFSINDYYDNFEKIIENICIDKQSAVNYYSHIRSRLYKETYTKENPILSEIYRLISIYYYNKSVKDYYIEDSSVEYVDNLFRLITCKYGDLKDASNKYIIKNGKRQKGFILHEGKFILKSKELYDLGTFMKDYNEKLTRKNIPPEEPEDFIEEHKNEREEFLTDEDYQKYGV